MLFIELFENTCKDSVCSFENLQQYVSTCSQFRSYCEDHLEKADGAYSTPFEALETTMAVNRAVLAGLRAMLTMIVAKRNAVLGGGSQKTAAGEPGNYQDFDDFLERGVHLGSIPLTARRANQQGKSFSGEKIINFTPPNKKRKVVHCS